jgi:hypothetical protein
MNIRRNANDNSMLEQMLQQARAQGLKDGLFGVDTRADYERAVRGMLGAQPGTAGYSLGTPQAEELERLKERKQEIDARLEAYRMENGDRKPELWNWNPVRVLRVVALLGLVAVLLNLAGVKGGWREWTILCCAVLLLTLRPWGTASALRRALLHFGGDVAYIGRCFLSGRFSARIQKKELEETERRQQEAIANQRVMATAEAITSYYEIGKKYGTAALQKVDQHRLAKGGMQS